jgi:dTDP-4-dehydrorhamnose 3,5-epimerase
VSANPDQSHPRKAGEDLEVVPAGTRDVPTVAADGRRRAQLEGVVAAAGVVHADHRGTLMETINFDNPFWEEPVVYAYAFTVAPGRIKGWGMHRQQADRYVALAGRLRVVLYDGRADSPTFQSFAEFYFADEAPGFLRIPPGVWHADQNVGEAPCRLINFPTRPYDRDAPDKYRIDPASGEIPFDFTLRDG